MTWRWLYSSFVNPDCKFLGTEVENWFETINDGRRPPLGSKRHKYQTTRQVHFGCRNCIGIYTKAEDHNSIRVDINVNRMERETVTETERFQIVISRLLHRETSAKWLHEGKAPRKRDRACADHWELNFPWNRFKICTSLNTNPSGNSELTINYYVYW